MFLALSGPRATPAPRSCPTEASASLEARLPYYFGASAPPGALPQSPSPAPPVSPLQISASGPLLQKPSQTRASATDHPPSGPPPLYLDTCPDLCCWDPNLPQTSSSQSPEPCHLSISAPAPPEPALSTQDELRKHSLNMGTDFKLRLPVKFT